MVVTPSIILFLRNVSRKRNFITTYGKLHCDEEVTRPIPGTLYLLKNKLH
jgi:hypothetical protein